MTFADAIIYGHTKEVKQHLETRIDINEIDEYGYTPLNEAAIGNHPEIARLLLERGAKVNATDLVGNTSLHWAVENYNLELAELLLKYHANPNAYTNYGQPVLVKALLRGQQDLKELLYRHGANLLFAQDYIYIKLLGHRFELTGRADIIDPGNKFVEIDFEGFIIEFTVSILLASLQQFINNFAARNWRDYFPQLQQIIDAYSNAAELLKYQQYLVNIKQHQERIDTLLTNELLLLPIGCEGHALTLIKYGNILAKCDRGAYSLNHPSVTVYKMRRPQACTPAFMKQLLYKKQSMDVIHQEINKVLDLEVIDELRLASQISGNCSWANMEGALPTMLFMLTQSKQAAVDIFEEWRQWDKERALHECIENFYGANPARKAAIAATLAAVLFQSCRYLTDEDLPSVNKILNIFKLHKEYKYILNSYLKIYNEQNKTAAGNNLLQLLDIAA
jgi:hypothetical protein